MTSGAGGTTRLTLSLAPAILPIMNGKTGETVKVTGHYRPSDSDREHYFREGTAFPPSPHGNHVRWTFAWAYRGI